MCEVSRTMEVTIREIYDAKPRQSHTAIKKEKLNSDIEWVLNFEILLMCD